MKILLLIILLLAQTTLFVIGLIAVFGNLAGVDEIQGAVMIMMAIGCFSVKTNKGDK